MAPRSEEFKQIRQRLRRSLHYGTLRMNCLTIQLSELVINYFDRCSNFDWLDADFAARMSREGCLDPCTLVAAMIYIERLRRHNPAVFQRSNPNDLYLSSLIVATKFLNDCGLDEYVWTDEWAEAAAVSVKRIRQLELRLLDDLSWDLMITAEQFDEATRSLERAVAIKSAQTAGFFSYTDINSLVTDFRPFLDHVQRFMAMSLTLTSAYLAFWALTCGLFVGVTKMIETPREDTTCVGGTVDVRESPNVPPILLTTSDQVLDECVQFDGPIEMNGTKSAVDGLFNHDFFLKSLLTLRNHNGLFDAAEVPDFDWTPDRLCDHPGDYFVNSVLVS